MPDFRSLHWSSLLGLARMTVDFTDDSIVGATSGPPGRQTIRLANRGDLLVGAPMTEFALQGMQLAVGRQDSVTVLLIDLGQTRNRAPAVIAVDGEEDVVTPQGRVHCWVVTLRAGDAASRLWVSQRPTVWWFALDRSYRGGRGFSLSSGCWRSGSASSIAGGE